MLGFFFVLLWGVLRCFAVLLLVLVCFRALQGFGDSSCLGLLVSGVHLIFALGCLGFGLILLAFEGLEFRVPSVALES